MVTVNITMPELENALERLAAAILANANVQCPTPAAPAPVAPAPVAPTPVAPAPVAQAPVAPAPVAQAPVAPAPVAPAHVAPAPVAPAPVAPAPVAQAPTAVPQYSVEALMRAGAALATTKYAELQSMLAKYGVNNVRQLDPQYYGALAADLRALGAQI